MGKKRKTGPAARDGAGAAAAAQNKELDRLLLQILDVTTKIPDSKEEWDQFVTVHSLVESVRRLEQNRQPSCFAAARDGRGSLDAFLLWLTTNGVDVQSICLEDFGDMGLGLTAASHLKAGEKFASIPRRVMILSDVSDTSPLSSFLRSDPIASKMSNVALALHVLHEKTADDSFWKPYLDVLPASYATPLYFTPDELLPLRGSPSLSECISLCRSIARQYAYFHRQLASDAALQAGQPGLPLHGRFTYDGYRWAVSTVMTRQNSVPRSPHDVAATVSTDCSALIPLWDMCNHAPGMMMTDYSTELDCCQSYTCTEVSPGQQIFICYGRRSNREFFVHSGFVSPDNPHDKVLIKLGLSKNDPLFVKRSALLERIGLISSHSYEVQSGEHPVAAPLLAFLRTFNASADELEKLLSQHDEELAMLLTDSRIHISKENSMKAWSFLASRVELLLRAYPAYPSQSVQVDGVAPSPHARLANSLVLEEKKVLQHTLDYCWAQVAGLQSSA